MALENAYDDEEDEGFGDEFHTVSRVASFMFEHIRVCIPHTDKLL